MMNNRSGQPAYRLSTVSSIVSTTQGIESLRRSQHLPATAWREPDGSHVLRFEARPATYDGTLEVSLSALLRSAFAASSAAAICCTAFFSCSSVSSGMSLVSMSRSGRLASAFK